MKLLRSSYLLTITFLLACLFVSNSIIAQGDEKDAKIVADANAAKADFIKGDALMQSLFDNSSGYVIFPNVGKGAIGIGGAAGNGAVFQLVPQRFRREIGVMTGLIGMAGGIGGFALAAGMGAIKQSTGSYQLALWLFASLGVLAWFGLHGVKRRWRTTWGSAAVTAARV